MAIGDWLGSLFGGTPTYTPQPGGTGTPPGTLAGLLDPRGIREQAFYSGLGALSQGLLAAGMRRPAASPSPLPQALGAFQPAYQGALQSGYQTAAAEQQMRQQQQDEQYLEQYRRSNPAYANLPRAALIAQISRTPPTGFEPDPTQPGRMRPIGGGPADTAYARALADAQRDPNVVVTEGGAIVDRATGRVIMARPPAPTYHTDPRTGEVTEIQRPAIGGSISQPGGQPQPTPAPGVAPPGQPGQPQAAPSSAPLSVRLNNPLNLGGEDRRWAYPTPEDGTAAAVRQITLNASRNNGALTPVQLAQSWIRPSEGESPQAFQARVQGYGARIAQALEIRPDQAIPLSDPAAMVRVVRRMAEVEAGGILPQGWADAISRGVQQGFQPGPISPSNPTRMYAGAGGAGPRAQPAVAPSAAPPATAAPPQAAAPPVAGPPGTQSRVVVPGRTVDPLEVAGTGFDANLFNTYTRLERKRVTEGLTQEEAWLQQLVRQRLEAVQTRPDGSQITPPQLLPLPDRAAPTPPAAGAPGPAPAPPAQATTAPAPAAPTAPADGRPPSQVARFGEPAIPDGMYRRRNAAGGFTDIPLQQQPAPVVTELTNNVTAISGIDRALGELAQRERSVGAIPGAIARITGDMVLQRTDPEGVALRAMIANIRSMTIHERSGASTTVAEMAVLRDFIPAVSDTHETIRTKLAGLRERLADMTNGMYEAYGPSADYRGLPHVERAVRPPEPTPGSFRQTPYLMTGALDETAESGVRPGQVYQLNLRDGTQAFGRWVVRPPTGGMERRAGFEPVIWRNGRWVARPEGQ